METNQGLWVKEKMIPVKKPYQYKNFVGIDNVNDKTNLITRTKAGTFVSLLQAENVDIHTDFTISRRAGFALVLSGSYKSVWATKEICLAVNGGDLVEIKSGFTTQVLYANVGTDDMAYEAVYDESKLRVYFTNGTIIGKVRNGAASLLSGTDKDYKEVLPAGNIIKFFRGSLYVVAGKVIYISDVLNREIYDRRWGFKLFETNVRMFEPVSDGFYVSDEEGVYFLKREESKEIPTPVYSVTMVDDVPAEIGTGCVLLNITSPEGAKYETAVVWQTKKYFCLGGDKGKFEKILDKKYQPVQGRIGASLFRVSGDLNQYISIVR